VDAAVAVIFSDIEKSRRKLLTCEEAFGWIFEMRGK
jgi:hypothetical protein